MGFAETWKWYRTTVKLWNLQRLVSGVPGENPLRTTVELSPNFGRTQPNQNGRKVLGISDNKQTLSMASVEAP